MEKNPLLRRLGAVSLLAGLGLTACSAPRTATPATTPWSAAAPRAVAATAPPPTVEAPAETATGSATGLDPALGLLNPGPFRLTQEGPDLDDYRIPKASRPRWELGGARLQGYLGVTELTDVTRTADSGPGGASTDDNVTMPTIGGGGQWKLAGNRIDWGLEGLLSISGRGNISALAVGGGGAVVAVNLDLLVVDFYGGPFMSFWLTDRFRLYGGAGPIVVFSNYSQDAQIDTVSRSGSGFGTGWYGRLGTEFLIGGGTAIGIGARFSDTRVDLDSGLGDLDLEGLQYMFTVSTGW